MKKCTWMVVLATFLLASPAFAQDKRAEVSVLFGWTFSDGVDGEGVRALNGNIYDRIDPKDSFKWSVAGGALSGPNAEVGFMFGQQMSKLVAGGTTETEIGDMTVNNYHGYFGYNFGDERAMARPYLFGGLGATQFSSVDYTRIAGAGQGTIQGETQFSTTWGAGVKVFPNPSVGVRLGLQWTPTYIKSEEGGWWCDPFWGCYIVGNAKYANQIDFSGGLSVRF